MTDLLVVSVDFTEGGYEAAVHVRRVIQEVLGGQYKPALVQRRHDNRVNGEEWWREKTLR